MLPEGIKLTGTLKNCPCFLKMVNYHKMILLRTLNAVKKGRVINNEQT